MFIKLDDNNETVINTEHLAYFGRSEAAGYSGKPEDRVATIRFAFHGGMLADARYDSEADRDSDLGFIEMRVGA